MNKKSFYILSKLAEDDLRAVMAYSSQYWGPKIAKSYLTDIHNKCLEIHYFPDCGILRTEIMSNLRSVKCNSHIIFYEVYQSKIYILRVLHKNMDLENSEIYSLDQ